MKRFHERQTASIRETLPLALTRPDATEIEAELELCASNPEPVLAEVVDNIQPSPILFAVSFNMLARRSVARLVSQPAPLGAAPPSARNMATLRELELRLKSVRNIEKITKVRCLLWDISPYFS